MIMGQPSFIDKLDEAIVEIKRKTAALRAANDAWKSTFCELMSYQNGGAALEGEGRLEEAVIQYEEAVNFGRQSDDMKVNNYYHSIERLAILYRKLKRYDDEIRIINEALSDDITEYDRLKLAARLEKAIKLKEKL